MSTHETDAVTPPVHLSRLRSVLRFGGRGLKFTLLSVMALLVLAFAGAFVIVAKPQLVLNDRTLAWAIKYAQKKGIDIRVGQAHIEVQSPSLLRKRVALRLGDACVNLPDNGVHGCFKRIELAAAADFSKFSLKVTELGPVSLLGGNVLMDLVEAAAHPKAADKPKDTKSSGSSLAWLEGADIHPLQIDLDQWRVVTDRTTSIEGKLDFRGKTEAQGPRLVAHVQGERVVRKPGQGARQGSVRGRLDARLRLEADGTEHWEKLRAALDAKANDLVPKVDQIEVHNCVVEASRPGKGAGLGKAESETKVGCPVAFTLPVPPRGTAWETEWKRAHLPTRGGLHISADLKSQAFPPAMDAEGSGHLEVVLDPILNPLFKGQVKALLDYTGIPARLPREGKALAKLAVDVNVPKFGRLVKHLDGSPFAIPAPIRVLKGNLDLNLEGQSDLKSGNVPIVLTTRMNSKEEHFNLDGKGLVKLADLDSKKPMTDLNFDLVLSNVQLELPTLDLGAPPALFPDARIHRGANAITVERAPELNGDDASPANSAFHYRAHVTTPAGGPIRILTNLAKAPIPIEVDVSMASDEALGGSIKVDAFPVEFFHRKAVVDHFNIALDDPTSDSVLDGRIKLDYADYEISILIVSSMKKPQIVLESDPPLNQDDIISVLLYGETQADLDAEQGSSVGNTRNAFSDKAIGLASLFVLGSTPVQSVNYDPTSKVVTAKFKIGKGISLNVGTSTDGNSPQVGLHKRLGPHWSISTDVSQNLQEGGKSSASAFLEWSNRY